MTNAVLSKLNLQDVNPGVIESLFSADLAFLQDFYRRINEAGTSTAEVDCPACEHHFEIDVGRLGGS